MIEEEFVHSHSVSSNSMIAPNYDYSKSFISSGSASRKSIKTSSYQNRVNIIYLMTTFINTLIGLYVIYKHGIILKSHLIFVYFYIISYTFLWPLTLVIAILVALFIAMIKKIMNQISGSNDTNKTNYFSYIMLVFISVLIILYCLSIPSSIYMLFLLKKNRVFYPAYKTYSHVYVFVIVNLIKSISIAIYCIYHILKHKYSYKRIKIEFDDEFIREIENEIEQANKVSGVIAPDKNLIKMNDMFNRQYIQHDKNIIEVNQPNKLLSEIEISQRFFRNKRFSIERLDTYRTNESNSKFLEMASQDKNILSPHAKEKLNYLVNEFNYETKEHKKNRIKNTIRTNTLIINKDNSNNYIKNLKSQLTMKEDLNKQNISKSPSTKRKSDIQQNGQLINLFKIEDDNVVSNNKDSSKSSSNKSVFMTKGSKRSFPFLHSKDDINFHLGSTNYVSDSNVKQGEHQNDKQSGIHFNINNIKIEANHNNKNINNNNNIINTIKEDSELGTIEI